MSDEREFHEGSGNVFADLGLRDADELYTRAKIGYQVQKILKDRKLKQREMADVLAIAQPDVSLLMRGKFNRFSTEKLVDFLKRLDQDVILVIHNRHQNDPQRQDVSLAL
jgi:predicted XRE-type DNA-binding protein